MTSEENFVAIQQRIENVLVDPSQIKAPFTKLIRPILSRMNWQPRPCIESVHTLWDALQNTPAQDEMEPISKLFEKAWDELEDNVKTVERAYIVNRQIPVAYVAWLQRLCDILQNISRWIQEPETPENLAIANSAMLVSLLPPLSVRAQEDEATTDELALVEETETSEETALRVPDPERLLALELGAIDHLIEAAHSESQLIGRRRRFLEAARQLLLDTSTALPLDESGLRIRQEYLSQEIVRLNRLEALGLSPEVSLLHQTRLALGRNDIQRFYAGLVAMDRFARIQGDRDFLRHTRELLSRIEPNRENFHETDYQNSIDTSAMDLFGEEILTAIQKSYQLGRDNLREDVFDEQEEQYLLPTMRNYLGIHGAQATARAALSVDGLFEVGGTLSPRRVTEYRQQNRLVPYPTQQLTLTAARNVTDIPTAVIDDPRQILLSLASGRLLSRRFIQQETIARKVTILQSEVRVYVLDGSLSMLGPRARMRDAILLAELGTLHQRLQDRNRTIKTVLYYRYFNEDLLPQVCVDSVPGIFEAISDILSVIRRGNTNIQNALLASFAQIRQFRKQDPNLIRAQIVLITDGEAPIDEAALQEARKGLDDLPIGVSVIALGEENPALRALVAKQRAQGERAFYHFLDDASIARHCNGEADQNFIPHLSHHNRTSFQANASEITRELDSLLDSLSTLGRERDLEALDHLEAEAQARKELSLGNEVLTQGELAKLEALHKDHRSLALRFSRWFPPVETLETIPYQTEVPPEDQDDVDTVIVLLATISEIITVVGGTSIARKADAIEILERLFVDARLSPKRYKEILDRYPLQTKEYRQSIYQLVTPR